MTTNKTTINTVINSLLSFHKEETSFNQTKEETYSTITTFMVSEGLTLPDLSARVAEKSKTWPVNSDKSKVGRDKAREAGCVEAQAFHRFAVWYGQNVAVDKDKAIQVDESGTFQRKEKKAPKTKGAQHKTAHDKDSANSETIALTGYDLLQVAFKEMAALIEKRRASVSKRAQIAECEEMSSMLTELQEFMSEVVNS